MAYLKSDSVPAQQEMRARHACRIISEQCEARVRADRKSHPITSKNSLEASRDLPFFSNHQFKRG